MKVFLDDERQAPEGWHQVCWTAEAIERALSFIVGRTERPRWQVTDYEREYRQSDSACGEPFAEFVDFFSTSPSGLSVLDLGCGQGRDALVAARHGHSVHGIDVAASGVAQLAARAEAEGLDVRCEVRDMEDFEPDRQYDAVLLDRVLHMLPSEERRRVMLSRAKGWVSPGGHVLLADTKRNRALIRGCFESGDWETVLERRDYFFARRTRRAAQQAVASDRASRGR